eukprot:TRINITY_DN27159_c0_g1_i1.p1 TRINITY_DN27159_c0_g1~~TRINITY_DN27159_c0_g1_i1.p1  ORF type:complete len:502 (-),score=87.47 TRINITY_DN27159_c0_g1_i1:9-1514(-)
MQSADYEDKVAIAGQGSDTEKNNMVKDEPRQDGSESSWAHSVEQVMAMTPQFQARRPPSKEGVFRRRRPPSAAIMQSADHEYKVTIAGQGSDTEKNNMVKDEPRQDGSESSWAQSSEQAMAMTPQCQVHRPSLAECDHRDRSSMNAVSMQGADDNKGKVAAVPEDVETEKSVKMMNDEPLQDMPKGSWVQGVGREEALTVKPLSQARRLPALHERASGQRRSLNVAAENHDKVAIVGQELDTEKNINVLDAPTQDWATSSGSPGVDQFKAVTPQCQVHRPSSNKYLQGRRSFIPVLTDDEDTVAAVGHNMGFKLHLDEPTQEAMSARPSESVFRTSIRGRLDAMVMSQADDKAANYAGKPASVDQDRSKDDNENLVALPLQDGSASLWSQRLGSFTRRENEPRCSRASFMSVRRESWSTAKAGLGPELTNGVFATERAEADECSSPSARDGLLRSLHALVLSEGNATVAHEDAGSQSFARLRRGFSRSSPSQDASSSGILQ